jgi:broad specificity polyphosphatase/5'/3'-nucleotidase SurE
VEAVLPLGEVLVVAPDRELSGGGRSMPFNVTGRIVPVGREINGQWVVAYAVDASPALAVVHGVTELAPRCPGLVVSGINPGVNLGIELTISGAVGAALKVDRMVSLTPLSLDLTARVDFDTVASSLGAEQVVWVDIPALSPFLLARRRGLTRVRMMR